MIQSKKTKYKNIQHMQKERREVRMNEWMTGGRYECMYEWMIICKNRIFLKVKILLVKMADKITMLKLKSKTVSFPYWNTKTVSGWKNVNNCKHFCYVIISSLTNASQDQQVKPARNTAELSKRMTKYRV